MSLRTKHIPVLVPNQIPNLGRGGFRPNPDVPMHIPAGEAAVGGRFFCPYAPIFCPYGPRWLRILSVGSRSLRAGNHVRVLVANELQGREGLARARNPGSADAGSPKVPNLSIFLCPLISFVIDDKISVPFIEPRFGICHCSADGSTCCGRVG